MVLLTIAIVLLALALWKVSSRADPHHTFFFSLLPRLDLEHSARTRCDIEQDTTTNIKAA